MWRVGGIKIERTRAQYFQTRTSVKIREILGWAIKGQMIYMHRGPNAFLAKSGCGAVLTLFWSPEVG